MDVCLLGCGGMMPLPNRWLTSLLVRHNGRMVLIDCGEATQIPLKLAGWGFKSIDAICFTHYHADHIAGLPGLLLTIGNSGRTEPLTLYGPTGLETVVRCLAVVSPQLPYPIRLGELPQDRPAAFPIGDLQIASLPVDHWIPCLSYTISLKRQGRFDAEKAKRAGIPVHLWKQLQSGTTVKAGGRTFTPETVLGPPRRGIKIGYCTDTRPTGSLPGFMAGCDLLICEGIYGDGSLEPKASAKKHMVFSQAADIARESESRELWLTHFSPALSDPEAYLPEARRIFENTAAGEDLMKKTLSFEP